MMMLTSINRSSCVSWHLSMVHYVMMSTAMYVVRKVTDNMRYVCFVINTSYNTCISPRTFSMHSTHAHLVHCCVVHDTVLPYTAMLLASPTTALCQHLLI
jgi:hypothetical protein